MRYNAGIMYGNLRQRTFAAIAGAAHNALRRGMDLLLPPRCVLCSVDQGEAPLVHDAFCSSCFADLVPSAGSTCRKCAMPVPLGTHGDCPHCRGKRFQFQAAIRAGVYEGALREALLVAKNLTGEPVAAAMGGWLADAVGEHLRESDEPPVDVVTCVPAYWLRRLARGSNSAAVIAQTLASQLRLPAALDLLICRRNIEKQSTLAISQRRANVRGAFRISWGYDIRKANVLLVDDVMTTGATAHELARVLRQAGANRVVVAVAARALGPDW